MSYKIRTLTDFDKSFKRLSKKYGSLGKDLKELLLQLQENPQLGRSLGNNFFKIRLKITSKSSGKSGGARIITCVKITDEQIFLAYIYDKSEESTVSDKNLKEWAKLIQ
ncbi:type II toxin-antitoxin system RelE/ParE family toxin [Emticicia oligotrophica]|uniref:type II toxin-antitoxin system RelE/ParE family toxin n=1 Tax=Emticicia oligotrophica TaxID=312279 RepID=UPI00273B363F|nr:type II toxin-antitoxin system RelE/ParE family toxin [Emticicia oligotrophica]